jgi:cell division protein FtsN
MKLLRTIIHVSMISAILIPAISFSQTVSTSDFNSFSFGVKGGLQYFYGDVRQQKYATDNTYKKANTCIGLEANKNFNSVFGVRLGAMTGGLTGSSPNLDLHFTSKMKEFVFEGIVNMNNLISFYPKKEKKLNTYIFAGIGMINFRSRIYTYNENSFITSAGWDSAGVSKTTARNELIIPMGLGIKFKADKSFDLGFEFSMQLTNTDKLDAWMVNKSYMDRYSHLTASVTFKIGKKKEYVDWVNPFIDSSKIVVNYAQNIASAEKDIPVTTPLTDYSKKIVTIENTVTTTIAENAAETTTPENIVKTTIIERPVVTTTVETPVKTSTTETPIVTNTVKQNTDTGPTIQSINTNSVAPANNTTPVATSTNNNTAPTATSTNVIVKKFFIIAGSYPTEQMAGDAVATLMVRGYANAEVVGKNDAGNWRICFKAYATRAEAENELPAIKASNSSAWIFEKKTMGNAQGAVVSNQ